MGGGPLPSPPKSSFLGGQQACEPVGGAETEQSVCTMGKRRPPLVNTIFIDTINKVSIQWYVPALKLKFQSSGTHTGYTCYWLTHMQ